MAYTFYRWIEHDTVALAVANIARFLINDHSTETGPAWTIIDTYSSAATTKHEVPSDATDMDSLAADNGWRTGTLAVSDYIILQSASASNKFQVGIEYQSTSIVRFIVAPLGGFSTVADNVDMTTAGNWASAKLSTFDYNVLASKGKWGLVADVDRFILFCKTQTTSVAWRWTFIGKLDSTGLYSTDAYPVVQYIGENLPYVGDGTGLCSANWKRLSLTDDSTEATGSVAVIATAGTNMVTELDAGKNALNDEWTLYRCYLVGTTSGHAGAWGFLPDIYGISKGLVTFPQSGFGTLESKTYAYLCGATNQGGIVFPWDGATSLDQT